VLPTNASKQLAENVISKFRRSLEKCNREANRGYDIAFSHGIVEFKPGLHRTIEKLLADGDALMYERKQGKR
jgi:PleD family two-component response regulator